MSTPIEIAVTWQRCKAEYRPSHADYVTGQWRLCPECRHQAPRPEPIAQEERPAV
jgi:hypothetical protein